MDIDIAVLNITIITGIIMYLRYVVTELIEQRDNGTLVITKLTLQNAALFSHNNNLATRLKVIREELDEVNKSKEETKDS